ncbi:MULTISPECIES: hypothetical protein [Nocardia]|uniref:hypothetical protein n=1 Tax=Nocardia TaxID=1817 RepID=UPI002455154C|nr:MULTISPECIES: hypothetical protein [Nocardia]
MTGEPLAAVEQNLGHAQQLLSAAEDAGGDGLGAYFNQGTLLVRSACCYTEAGKPHQAVRLFSDVLGSGTLSKRDSGLFGLGKPRRWRSAVNPMKRRPLPPRRSL